MLHFQESLLHTLLPLSQIFVLSLVEELELIGLIRLPICILPKLLLPSFFVIIASWHIGMSIRSTFPVLGS